MATNLISLNYAERTVELNNVKLCPLGIYSKEKGYMDKTVHEWYETNNNLNFRNKNEINKIITVVPEHKQIFESDLVNSMLKQIYLSKKFNISNYDDKTKNFLNKISDMETDHCFDYKNIEILGLKDEDFTDNLNINSNTSMSLEKLSKLQIEAEDDRLQNLRLIKQEQSKYIKSINIDNFDILAHTKFVIEQAELFAKYNKIITYPEVSCKESKLKIKFSKELDCLNTDKNLLYDSIIEDFKKQHEHKKLTNFQEMEELNLYIWKSNKLDYKQKSTIMKMYFKIDKMNISNTFLKYINDLEELREQQSKDPELVMVAQSMNSGGGRWNIKVNNFAKAKQSLYIKEGLIVWYNRNQDLLLPVVPKDTLIHILSKEHAKDHAGHKKSIFEIKKALYYPSIDEIALEISSTCFKCQTAKVHAIKSNPKIPYSKVDANCSLDLVYADCTFLQTTKDGFIGTINFIDVASRLAFAVPIKNRQSKYLLEAIKDKLKSTFLNGKIKCLRLDNAGEFNLTSDFAKYFIAQKTRILHGTPYNSFGGGLIERLNATMKSKLRMLKKIEDKKEWVDLLDKALYQYNNEVHTHHGMTPSSAFHAFNNNTSETAELLYDDLNEDELIADRMSYFKIGDYVLKKAYRVGNRKEHALADCFTGPFLITTIQPNKKTFLMSLINIPKKIIKAHYVQIKKWKRPSDELMSNATYNRLIGTFIPKPCQIVEDIISITSDDNMPTEQVVNSGSESLVSDEKNTSVDSSYEDWFQIPPKKITYIKKIKEKKLPTKYSLIDKTNTSLVYNLRVANSSSSENSFEMGKLLKDNRKSHNTRGIKVPSSKYIEKGSSDFYDSST
ncbi:unnamed protein product [Rotaria magnacalcarata]|nr:unnamed protein product [Rotaria magnacalcarata]